MWSATYAEPVHRVAKVFDTGRLRRPSRSDKAAALALQRSLLPNRLPDVPGVDLAARYVPGHEFGVGGDWYDVFSLPTGWLGVVIGDVAGHGLQSAVVMGRVRSALRAYALVCDDPAGALTLLDRKVHHFEAGTLTTAMYGMVSPDRTAVHVSLAGHLCPVLAHPDGPAALAPVPADPPLGIGRGGRPRRTTVVEMAPGAALISYTDGLVERRDEVIDVGLDRLCAAAAHVPADAAGIVSRVMTVTDAERPVDDVAVLVVRRR